jgi:hypothetical protein
MSIGVVSDGRSSPNWLYTASENYFDVLVFNLIVTTPNPVVILMTLADA